MRAMTETPAGRSTASGSSSEPSLGELVERLSTQTSRLVRAEIQLLQTELKDSVKHAGIGAGLGGAAGLLAILATLSLLTAAIAGLALVVPVWLSALIIAVVLLIGAAVAGLLAKKQVSAVTPAAPMTARTLSEDVRELKEARNAG